MAKLKTLKQLILAILDFIIIGIIIYGLTDYVYEGYPTWVPYLIMAFFFLMACFRFYKFSATLKESSPVDSHDVESLFANDDSDDDETRSPRGFKKRRRKNPFSDYLDE